jgi:hypothetical protein
MLDGIWTKPAVHATAFTKMLGRVLGRPEPIRQLDRPIQAAEVVRAVMLAIDQTKMRKINAIRAAPTPVAINA